MKDAVSQNQPDTRVTHVTGIDAHEHPVRLQFMGNWLAFDGPHIAPARWPLAQCQPIERYLPGRPLRLRCDGFPGERLIVHDQDVANALLASAPQLRGGYGTRGLATPAKWIGGIIAGVAFLSFAALHLIPTPLAFVMPESWRQSLGQEAEQTLTKGMPPCQGEAGTAALAALVARVAEGTDELPHVTARVFDIPALNAFAVPGERIVITSGALRVMERPEQLAGVLAHEMGHVIRRHPEAGLVRGAGLGLLLTLLQGNSGDFTSAASLSALLRYDRRAEEEADDIAQSILVKAAIDPLGLKEFFVVMSANETSSSRSGLWEELDKIRTDHPATADRIARIKPMPEGVAAREVITPGEWQALKDICD